MSAPINHLVSPRAWDQVGWKELKGNQEGRLLLWRGSPLETILIEYIALAVKGTQQRSNNTSRWHQELSSC